MKTIKKLSLAIFILFTTALYCQSSFGVIKGKITTTDELPLFGGLVRITQSGSFVGGTQTDEDGKYTYKPLNPGFYEITITSNETKMKHIKNIEVGPEKTTYVDAKVATNTTEEVVIESESFEKKVLDQGMTPMKSISGSDLIHMAVPRGDIKGAIVAIASDVMMGDDGSLHVRGSRGDATAFIVDGVRSQNITGVSGLSIANLSVITGGLPAQYGDVLGGVIVVTTKDYFSAIREKHMREYALQEAYEKKLREKNVKFEEEKRKKEIEYELQLEAECEPLTE